jgi:hypothetical protein
MIKRPKLRICGVEEEDEVQTKGIENLFNEIKAECSMYRRHFEL